MIALVINCSSFDFRSVWNHVEVESADFISWKVFNFGIKHVIRKFVLTFDSHFWSLILKVLDFRAKYIVISSWEPNDLDECGVEKCAIKETA